MRTPHLPTSSLLFNNYNSLFTAICILFVGLALTACDPDEGFGGNASIEGVVAHHHDPIANSIVYIKFDATEFPGSDVTLYDDETDADAEGNYEFTGLKKGNYYLYGVGWDSLFTDSVFGGVPAEISKKDEVLILEVPVTE